MLIELRRFNLTDYKLNISRHSKILIIMNQCTYYLPRAYILNPTSNNTVQVAKYSMPARQSLFILIIHQLPATTLHNYKATEKQII